MTIQASSALALFLLPLIFDMGCDDPIAAPKLACWLVAAGLASLRMGWRRSPQWIALLFWFGWSLCSAVYHGGSSPWLPLLPVLAGLIWSQAQQQPMPWLALGWGLTVLYSWLQRVGLDPADWSNPVLSTMMTIGGLGNPNFLTMYLAALLPIMWSKLYARGWLGWVVAILGLSTMQLAGTRGSLLALTVVLVFSTCLSRLQDKRFWVVTWALYVATLTFGWQAAPRFLAWQVAARDRNSMTRHLSVARSLSVTSRLVMWKCALQQAGEHPLLGTGPGLYGDQYLVDRPLEPELLRTLQRRPEDPHSEPLRVLSETGVVGFGLWSLWIGLALWRRRRDFSAESASLLVLLANGLTNSFPVAVWPLLVLWTMPPGKSRERVHPLGVLILLTTLLAGGASWLTHRAFWWDDDIKLYPQQTQALRLLRLQWLAPVEHYCPPWDFELLAMRNADGWLMLAQNGGEESAWVQADAWARRRLAAHQQSAYAWSFLGGIAQDRHHWAEAVDYWEQAKRRDPRNPAFWFFLARAQYLKGDSQAALNSARQSLEIYSKSSQVYQFRSQIMIEQGRTWESYWDWVRSEQVRQSE